jgi:nitrite reductase/ring-hydroxylating ferredoxin subunit
MLICGTVQCPWHGTQFDVKTGAVKAGPGSENIVIYKLEEEGNKLYLILNY